MDELLIRVKDGKATVVEQTSAGMKVDGAAVTVPAVKEGAKVGDKVTGADGNVYTIVAHNPSEMETALFKVIGVNQGIENPTYSTGDREVRARVLLGATGEYNYPFPTGRTVYELVRPAIPAAYAGHWNGAKGKVRVELAGDPGGAVNGGASLAANGTVIDGTIMEGNLDSYRKEVEVTGRLDVNLRLDGGAPTVLLVVTPL